MSHPTARPRARLALLALAQLIFALDIYIVFVALPELGADLRFSDQTLQWVVSAYLVTAGGFLLLGGRAADLLGRRRMFITALTLYGVSSLAGGLAQDQAVIVAARAVQGVGAALLLPATLSLIGTLFAEGPERNRALAVWGGAGATGLTLGSLLGGVLTEGFGWPAVFFVNVPLAGFAALAALKLIPRDPPRIARRRFDLPGALTATAGTTLFVFVLVQGPEQGWTSTGVVVAAAAAALLLGAFAAIEARTADPLLPLRLLARRGTAVAAGLTFTFMATFGTLPYFLTVLFQSVHGFSPLQTGLAFLAPAVAIAAGTQIGERATTALGARSTLLAGFGLGAAGALLLAPAFQADAGYAAALPGLVIGGVGQGIAWTGMWIAAAEGVGPDEHGVASGIASTALNVGNAIGLAVLVAVANAAAAPGDGAAGLAAGGRLAVLLGAGGMVAGAALALALRARPPLAAAAPEGA